MDLQHDPRVIDTRTRLARTTDPGTRQFLGFQLEVFAEQYADDRAQVAWPDNDEQAGITEDRYLGWLAGGVR